MNFYLVTFIIVCIIIGGIGTFKLFQSNRMITAGIFLVGSILTFVFYGLRWFGDSGSVFSQTPGQWPPFVNTCPDFLSFYKRIRSNGTTTDTCVDRVGVSRNGTLQVLPSSGDINPENDAYFFPLDTKSQEPDAKRIELCNRTIQYGLTWEGVSDGEMCYTPMGKSQVPAGNGTPSCPSASS